MKDSKIKEKAVGKNIPQKKEFKLITRDEADAILSERYPTDEELNRFPLGEALKTIPEVNESYGPKKDKNGNPEPGHIEKVIKGMNILLSQNPQYIVKQWEANPNPMDQNTFIQTTIKILRGDNTGKAFCQIRVSDLKPFLRLCVLYHDIGKSIIHERHPSVGWHLIKDVYKNEVEEQLFPLILNISYDEWPNRKLNLSEYEKEIIHIFEMVIKFHDLFGVLSTGEASLPVMVDLIPLTGTNPIEAKELFSILMLVNLADLFGSIKEVYPYKVNYFCRDWEILCNTIEESNGKRNLFFKNLLEKEQEVERTIERIMRFLKEGAPQNWLKELNDKEKITDAFRSATLSSMHSFRKNFALFCKLDYALAFKIKLMNLAYNNNDKQVSKPIALILWLFSQLERQYGDLCMHKDGTWRRIGLQLAGLTRKPSSGKDRGISKIGDTICNLLLETEKGKEWAAGECTVWFMEE